MFSTCPRRAVREGQAESAGEEQDPHALGFLPFSAGQELVLVFPQFHPTQVLLLGVRRCLMENLSHFHGYVTP